MKKTNQDTALFEKQSIEKKGFEENRSKTTNVNILLNRVRLDKKKTLKKRILISLFFALAVSSFVIYFII